MELKGSKTEANLMAAFAGESQARNKYTYYASAAKKEGYNQIAAISNSDAGCVTIGSVSLSGLAVASIVGILLNAILPGKDYEFGKDEQGDTSVNFKV